MNLRNEILKLMDKNGRIDFQDMADMIDTDLETIKKNSCRDGRRTYYLRLYNFDQLGQS